jgi:hypothetical protein
VQIVCRDVDFYPLREQFAACFPEAVLTARSHFLSSLWLNAAPARVLVDFGLSREFVHPPPPCGGFDPDPLASLAGALADLDPDEIGVFMSCSNQRGGRGPRASSDR